MPTKEIQDEVRLLKRREKAIILAHNYQRGEIQEVADHVGSSLQLCWAAAEAQDAKHIVFCGVDFMAESASILNPDKTVLMPDLNARCPMAAQLPAEEVIKAKEKYPEAKVMLYVNTLAEAKAEADVMCTSSNSVKISKKLDADQIVFGPDYNLAQYTQKRCPDVQIIPIPENGYCFTHKLFSPEVRLLKEKHPDAELLVHPECDLEVQALADFIGSTGQMHQRCSDSNSKKFIIATEIGLIERLRRELPKKEHIPAYDGAICRQMKRHTLEKVRQTLETKTHIIKVPEKIAKRARKGIERMLELS